MNQGELFDKPETIASPLCIWEACSRHGRCVCGEWEGDDECRTRTLRCLVCGRSGAQSVNLTVKTKGRPR